MTRFLTNGFMAVFLAVLGLAMLSEGMWRHVLSHIFMGAFLMLIGGLFSRAWHADRVDDAVRSERDRCEGWSTELADQAAEMMLAIIETAWPFLGATKADWGKDSQGRSEGSAIEVKDERFGDWSIDVVGRHRPEVYLYRTIANGVTDRQYKPSEWRYSLSDLVTRRMAKRG